MYYQVQKRAELNDLVVAADPVNGEISVEMYDNDQVMEPILNVKLGKITYNRIEKIPTKLIPTFNETIGAYFCFFSDDGRGGYTWTKLDSGVESTPGRSGATHFVIRYGGDSSESVKFNDTNAEYIVYYTPNTEPSSNSLEFFYKSGDDEYTKYTNTDTSDASVMTAVVPFTNLYIMAPFSFIAENVNISHTLNDDTTTTYTNIFSSDTTIEKIKPTFFKVYSGEADHIKITVSYKDEEVFRSEDTSCNYDSNWQYLFGSVMVCLIFGLFLCAWNFSKAPKEVLGVLVLTVIALNISFAEETNANISMIVYFIVVILLGHAKFSGGDESSTGPPGYVLSVISSVLILLILGGKKDYERTLKSTDEDCGKKQSKSFTIYLFIVLIITHIMVYLSPKPGFIRKIMFGVYWVISVVYYVWTLFTTKRDVEKTNDIFLGNNNDIHIFDWPKSIFNANNRSITLLINALLLF